MKMLRKERDWNQGDLAQATGYSKEHVARIESEKGSSWVGEDFVAACAKAFKVPESRLFFDPALSPTPSNKQILDLVNEALMERDMLRDLQRQGIVPAAGTPAWNQMLRAGLAGRHIVETAEAQVARDERKSTVRPHVEPRNRDDEVSEADGLIDEAEAVLRPRSEKTKKRG